MKKINKLEEIFRNFCVSLGELQPSMVSFYRKLDSNSLKSFNFGGWGRIFCGCGFVGVALGVSRTIFSGFGNVL